MLVEHRISGPVLGGAARLVHADVVAVVDLTGAPKRSVILIGVDHVNAAEVVQPAHGCGDVVLPVTREVVVGTIDISPVRARCGL